MICYFIIILDTHCAVFGNHDFDHGLDILEKWVERTNFPWLMSNVIDNETGRPLGTFVHLKLLIGESVFY